jgi:carbonic anhydrase
VPLWVWAGPIPEPEPEWTYSGDRGPEHWGDLKPEWATCKTGVAQSPVDLKWAKPSRGHTLKFHYRPTRYRVVDTGRTVQVKFDPGNTADVDGVPYRLERLEVHSESEHTFSGQSLPLEIHLVHHNGAGKTVVVAMLYKPGGLNGPLQQVISGAPPKVGEEMDWGGMLNPEAFLPSQRTFYAYSGSLTTPPCTEGVWWSVFNTPLEASPDQIARFQKRYLGNHRPIQALHDRRPANY